MFSSPRQARFSNTRRKSPLIRVMFQAFNRKRRSYANTIRMAMWYPKKRYGNRKRRPSMRSKNLLLVLTGAMFCFVSMPLVHGEEQAAAPPAPKVASSDNNKDGKPDQWQYYEFGQIIRTEADTNFDGKADELGYFSNGRLVRVEKDSDRLEERRVGKERRSRWSPDH